MAVGIPNTKEKFNLSLEKEFMVGEIELGGDSWEKRTNVLAVCAQDSWKARLLVLPVQLDEHVQWLHPASH